VVFNNKFIKSEAFFFQTAAGKFKNTFAFPAMKVVMMLLSC